MIYLDYTANVPAEPEVLARFCEVEERFAGNPNAVHAAGRAAAAEQAAVTASAAGLLGCELEELIFTSGGSEANNLAVTGTARAMRHAGRHIIATPLEHSSVSAPLTALQEQGWEVDLVDIGRDGRVELDHLRELLRRDTVLVAVSGVDSELGVAQPIREIAGLLRDYPDCRLHVDGVQAVGKLPVDLTGIDTFSVAPHKFGGLNGSGLLFKRKGLVLEPIIRGGASTTIYRSGTPTLALNASAETALRLAMENRGERYEAVRRMNGELRRALAAYPGVRINSPAEAIPHILNLSVQGVKGSVFRDALDRRGVCVSVKSACSTDSLPSRAVFAVSRDRKNALSSWRVSLSHRTTPAELEGFLAAFDQCYKELTS